MNGSYLNTNEFVLVRKGISGLTGGLRASTPVAVSLQLGRDSDIPNHLAVNIRLTGEILDELGWPANAYVQLHEGTGTSAGKVLLVRVEDGRDNGYLLSYSSGIKGADVLLKRGVRPHCSLKIMASRFTQHTVGMVPDKDRKSTAAKHRAFNGELLVEMPSWFAPVNGDNAEDVDFAKSNTASRNKGGRPRKNA